MATYKEMIRRVKKQLGKLSLDVPRISRNGLAPGGALVPYEGENDSFGWSLDLVVSIGIEIHPGRNDWKTILYRPWYGNRRGRQRLSVTMSKCSMRLH